MHIGYVLKRYPRFSETFVVNEILAHEAVGIEVTIFALRSPADTHFQPAVARVRGAVHYLPSASLRANEFWSLLEPHLAADHAAELAGALDAEGMDVYQALVLAQLLSSKKIDHIHAHFATSAATVARLASKLTQIPYTLTAHAKDIYHEYVNPAALEQKVADAAGVITVSEYNKRHLQTQFPQYGDKIHRIYNGIPLREFAYQPPINRAPLILGVGRLVEKKGFCDLIEACSLLSQQGVKYECQIIGGGELEPMLRQQIVSLNLDGQVRLVGPLPSDQVATTIRQAAVLVAPCITASTGDRDGLPTVLLEAIACGTPCVATDVTGIPEIIHDQQTGLLVKERSPNQLANAIAMLIHQPVLGERLAAAARTLIEESFDIAANTATQRRLFGATKLNDRTQRKTRGSVHLQPQLAEVG